MHRPLATLAALASTASLAAAQSSIANALASSDPLVRTYDAHVTTLANPAMGGRLPGSQGMEWAKQYVEHYFEAAGLEPAFGSGEPSWRQPFPLGRITAENVGGVLPGVGELADEYVVVGAHLDHLGTGLFGSRGTVGMLHPGADDNASGVAGILVLAEMLAADFADDTADRRGVLFLAFSGEESGLHGANYYVDNPIAAADKHALMINFDMIGRIQGGGVSVSGAQSGEGLRNLLEPIFEESDLTETIEGTTIAASDHWSFYAAGIPVLFGSASSINPDYHTEDDVSWKINRVDAVRAMRVFADVIEAAATHADGFEFVRSDPQRSGPSMADIRVRFGIRPGAYGDGESGVAVGGVSPDTSAEAAGLREGDVLIAWDGEEIGDIRGWMGMLARHDPGDVVVVTILRDGDRQDIEVTLQGKSGN
ncbi:MAG: M28 family peptidase [Planctomycetota bacterium]